MGLGECTSRADQKDRGGGEYSFSNFVGHGYRKTLTYCFLHRLYQINQVGLTSSLGPAGSPGKINPVNL